jgi:hypothetical protein
MRLIVNRILPLVVIPGIFLLVVAGCKKSSNNSNSTGSMTASINGTAWTASYGVAGLYTVTAGQFEVAGAQIASGDSTAFYITFNTPVMAGKAISSDSGLVDIQFNQSKGNSLYDGGALAGHSVLTVTDWDSIHLKIGGTFSGVLYNVTSGLDSVTVTGGAFTAYFTLN